MSDNLRIQLNIEIYNQAAMLNDKRAELLKDLSISVLSEKYSELGMGAGAFFISGSVY